MNEWALVDSPERRQAIQDLLTKLRLCRRWMTTARWLKWGLYAPVGLPVWWLYETQSRSQAILAVIFLGLTVNLALVAAYVQGYCEARYEALEAQARELLDA